MRNDDRFAGIYGGGGNRRYDDGTINAQAVEDSSFAASSYAPSAPSGVGATGAAVDDKYYGTNFEDYGPGVGHFSSSAPGDTVSGWEYAARGFSDGITQAVASAVNR